MHQELRGAYIARLDLTEPHIQGVAKKIRAQVKALSEAAHHVDIFYPAAGSVLRNDEVLICYGMSSLWRRINYYLLFYLFVSRLRLSVDFIYIRYQRSSPLFLYTLSRIRASSPDAVILVELPSYPYHTESFTFRERVFNLIDYLSRPFLRFYVDRIVTFSAEKKLFGIPTICTANGVDAEALELMQIPDGTETVRLVGLANLSFWHGYDRVISGLENYYKSNKKRRVIFDVVGTGQELQRLKMQAQEAGLVDHVIFHGPLHGDELDSLMKNCHIGISSIGMHRLKVDTSNLKSREFCARGIPFVIAYPDRDFDNTKPFVFHAPANDEPIDIQTLMDFYDELKATHLGFNKAMRNYALSHLTWQVKLKPVMAYICEQLDSRKHT